MAPHLHSRLLHSSALLAIADVHCSCPRSAPGAEEHNACTSLAIARSGVFVRHLGQRTLAADANTSAIFRPGRAYRVSHPTDGGDDCTSIRPSPDALREILRPLDPAAADRDEPAPRMDSGPCPHAAFLLQALLLRALRSPWPDPVGADEAGLRLTARLLGAAYASADAAPRRAPRTPATDRAHAELAERVKAHLGAHLGERLDLGAIARAVHASPFHLSRVFRERTGLTISAYLATLRVRHAARDVLEGETDLALAAVRAGFYDQSHFTNACRREFGLSPSRLRALAPQGLRQMSKLVQEPGNARP